MFTDGMAFEEAKKTAGNVPRPGERGNYTAEMFLMDFPQFHVELASDDMLHVFVEQANDSVLPSRWGSMWRYAAGLYTAHFMAMYLATYNPNPASTQETAAAAVQTGSVRQATMGDTSISYDNSAITSGTEKWGAWNATQYGQQLVTLARMVGMGGMYVI